MHYPLIAYNLVRDAQRRTHDEYAGGPVYWYRELMVNGAAIGGRVVGQLAEDVGLLGVGILERARIFNRADICRIGGFDPTTAWWRNSLGDLRRDLRGRVRWNLRLSMRTEEQANHELLVGLGLKAGVAS